MKIAILTSRDFLFAGKSFLEAASRGLSVDFINVEGSQRNIISKKAKLVFLFGFVDTILALIHSFINKHKIPRGNFFSIRKNEIEQYVLESDYDIVLLINYPWIFSVSTNKRVLNCHPSLLPKYRGLMPICHAVNDSILFSNEIETGLSIHTIDEDFDMGSLVWQKQVSLTKHTSLFDVYRSTYGLIDEALDHVLGNASVIRVLPRAKYFGSMSFGDVFKLKKNLLLNSVFVKFLINGGVIGILSWAFQLLFYFAIDAISPSFEDKITYSVYLAFIVVLLINFFSLKKIVFRSDGMFYKFVIVTSLVIFLVGKLAGVLLPYLNSIIPDFALYICYPAAALILAPFSFILKKVLVFQKNE